MRQMAEKFRITFSGRTPQGDVESQLEIVEGDVRAFDDAMNVFADYAQDMGGFPTMSFNADNKPPTEIEIAGGAYRLP